MGGLIVLNRKDACGVAELDTTFGQQNKEEFDWLCDQVYGKRAFLEIGSCFGQAIQELAYVCKHRDSKLRSIDIGMVFEAVNNGAYLYRRFAALRDLGFDAEVLLASSHSALASLWARMHGPYDMILIDGDHSYEGVKSDWEVYGPMGNLIAFHDIAHPVHGVKQLWNEIKASGARTDEKICSQMGIGVVFQNM